LILLGITDQNKVMGISWATGLEAEIQIDIKDP